MLTISQRLALAAQHQEAGHLGEAEALYRGILQEAPRHPHALHLLGMLAHQTRRHQEAIDLMQSALAAHGPHPIFHSNLAVVYLAAGRQVEAEAHSREALRLRPDLPEALNNLGLALRGKGQFAEAANAFREALRQNPNMADARRNLDSLRGSQGKLADARDRLRELVRQEPDNAQAQNDLALVLLAGDQAAQAIPHLQAAIRLRPDFAEAYVNLGIARQGLNEADAAMQCFQQALVIDPANVRARNHLGYTLEIQGRTDEAVSQFQEVLRGDPNNSQALFHLSEMVTAGYHHFSEADMRRLQDLAARPDLAADAQCRVHFALAQVFDRSGAYDQAFAHCRRANELRREIDCSCGVAFDPAAHRQLVDRLMATFTPAYFERVRSFGSPSELPVFIVGMLRSGTSLAEQILASHPQIHGAGELRDMGMLGVTLPQRLAAVEDYPECMADLDAATARTLTEAHLQKLQHLGAGKARVVDKSPLNFLNLGIIASLFPKARVIHCRRDPIDTCLSCYFQNFADPFSFALDLGHLGMYYREYERLMKHWAQVLPLPLLELPYEQMTAHQETMSRRLVAFCGLDWDDRCLRFHDTRRVVRTASALQIRQPMYQSSVGRWKRYEACLQPLLQALMEHPA